MSDFQDAFISYGRADSKTFAEKLNQRLLAAGLRSWFDVEDIPIGVDYQKQINQGIERTHNFLFVISPHSINSIYCGKELDLALKCHKRIIPILHVEEISYDCWCRRFPQGTDQEWADYQRAGLHSCHANMRPELARINWASFREGIDDFETAFTTLLTLFQNHRAYVHHHTYLLDQALRWQREERHPKYLLSGEERLRAERWLKYPVAETNLPCPPTDLHCEYITESTKNAHNLMTQVFLAYAEEDRAVAQQVRRCLNRQGITVWTSQRDIESGTDFHISIQKGIEEADNVVYLLSPDACRSDYCDRELALAQEYHKRIIPLLVYPVHPGQMAPALRPLQQIDLTEPPGTEVYQQGISRLLNSLQQDASYHETHKRLLVKALKWEHQHRNTSILLRGYNLRHAQAWLAIADIRKEYAATPLQQEFLAHSLQHPPDLALDVFVSYSRVDADFARRLNEALQIQGKVTWFDQESIASGADFQQEIYRGIESCDNFLFILSPPAVQSPYCADEVKYAAQLKKRIIPVLYRPVDAETLPMELAKIQWIDFSKSAGDFYICLGEVIRTLDTDRDHVRSHTRLSRRALEWQQANRSHDLLLRGNEYALAAGWLEDAVQQGKKPSPWSLQRELIAASRLALQAERDQERRQANVLRSLLSIVANAYTQAEAQRQRAEIVQEGQIRALSRYSQALQAAHQTLEAQVESIRAGRQLQQQLARVPVSPSLQAEVIGALRSALVEGMEFNQISGHTQPIPDVTFSPDGGLLATASLDNTLCLWNEHGALLQTLEGHTDAVYGVCFSPDGRLLATAGADNTVRLWLTTGELKATLPGHEDWVYSVRFHPDGQRLASCSVDRTAIIWTLGGTPLHSLAHPDTVIDVCFSPDGTQLATACVDGAVRIWAEDGTLKHTWQKHTAPVTTVQFSPRGDTVISGSVDGTLRLWSLVTEESQALKGHQDAVWKVRYSPDGQTIVSASSDNSLRFWNLAGYNLLTLQGHRDTVSAVAWHPTRPVLVSGSYDKTVRLWRCTIPQVQIFPTHSEGVNDAVLLTPAATLPKSGAPLFATGGAEGQLRFWSAKGAAVQSWSAHNEPIKGIAFSAEQNLIATASIDTTVKLWRPSGELLQTFKGHQLAVRRVVFGPGGRWLASASYDKTVGIWATTGARLCTLEGHSDQVWDVAISPRLPAEEVILATASWDKTVCLWRLGKLSAVKHPEHWEHHCATLKPWKVLTEHRDVVASLCFSPDGEAFATASQDRTVKIWSLDGQVQVSLEHEQAVTAVCFSADGHWIVTAGFDRQITVWSRSGQRLQTLPGHTNTVWRLQFYGDQLVSASEDGTVRVWSLNQEHLQLMTQIHHLPLGSLIDRTCQQVQDYLQHNLNLGESDRTLCQPPPLAPL